MDEAGEDNKVGRSGEAIPGGADQRLRNPSRVLPVATETQAQELKTTNVPMLTDPRADKQNQAKVPNRQYDDPDSTLLDRWLSDYFAVYISRHLSIRDTDKQVHDLVSTLLILGSDDEAQYTQGLHHNKNTLEHEELIQAILVRVKPGHCT